MGIGGTTTGEKTGKGYYKYEGKKAVEDPEALRLVEQARAEVGAQVGWSTCCSISM